MRYPLQILSVLLTLSCSGLWGSSHLPARDKLILHLSADRGMERNYRGAISRWTNQSGGLEFIVPSEQLSPVFKPATLNGHGVIHFRSTFLTGLHEFRFAEDPRPHVVFLIGEKEYQTETTLPELAVQELQPRGLRFSFVHADAENIHRFPGIEVLDSADLLVLSVRRRNPPEEQLAVIRKYLEAGRPLVGIRTSSHGFGLRDQQPPPPGHAAWPAFDREVLGGTYHGHHGNNTLDSPRSFFWVIPEASGHPVLKGLSAGEIQTRSWLYKHLPLADEARPLLMGRVGERLPHEPVAWVHSYGQSRVFYTSLGHPRDFDLPAFPDRYQICRDTSSMPPRYDVDRSGIWRRCLPWTLHSSVSFQCPLTFRLGSSPFTARHP